MSHSTNTRYGSISSKETLAIVPNTYPTQPYLTKSDLNNIQNDIKDMTNKYHFDIKAINDHITATNDHISDMFEIFTGTSYNKDKQEEQVT